MKLGSNIRLTAAEIGDLWTSYMNDSMVVCILKYFYKKSEDRDIKKVIKYALDISEKHVKRVKDILNKENLPVPIGFSEEDLNIDAPPLYSDILHLYYLEHLARFAMIAYGTSLPIIAREDVREYITNSLESAIKISNKTVDLLLKKGIFVRPPYIEIPSKPENIEKNSYIAGWFGDKRPINTIEILNLFTNIRNNTIGKTLLLGFSQVVKEKEVSKYMVKGTEIASKHIEVFSRILSKDNIPSSTNWDVGVTSSTTPPFSSRLMMFHTVALIGASITNYGHGMATSMRRDIQANYVKLSAEIAGYAKDGLEIMIKNKWFEKPPNALNHIELKEH